MVNIEEGFLSLMEDGGGVRDDVRLPESDLGKEIQAKFDNEEQFMVTVVSAMDTEMALATKNMAK